MKRDAKCSICGGEYAGTGNNAAPFDGRCCTDCDNRFVTPVRMLDPEVYARLKGVHPKPRIGLDEFLEILRLIARHGRINVFMAAKARELIAAHAARPDDALADARERKEFAAEMRERECEP